MTKLLVCGTRKSTNILLYSNKVYEELELYDRDKLELIEGCCPSSADEYAEVYAKVKNLKITHFPSTSGNYLKRNIEMVTECDEVLAFYDHYSYGTSQTIANAVMMGKPVKIIKI